MKKSFKAMALVSIVLLISSCCEPLNYETNQIVYIQKEFADLEKGQKVVIIGRNACGNNYKIAWGRKDEEFDKYEHEMWTNKYSVLSLEDLERSDDIELKEIIKAARKSDVELKEENEEEEWNTEIDYDKTSEEY